MDGSTIRTLKLVLDVSDGCHDHEFTACLGEMTVYRTQWITTGDIFGIIKTAASERGDHIE